MCVSHAFRSKKKSFNVTSSFPLRQVRRTRVFNKFSSVFRFFMHTKYSLAMFFCSIPQPPREIANKYLPRSFLRHDPRQMNAFWCSCSVRKGADFARAKTYEEIFRENGLKVHPFHGEGDSEGVLVKILCISRKHNFTLIFVCVSQFSQFFIFFTNFSFMIEFFLLASSVQLTMTRSKHIRNKESCAICVRITRNVLEISILLCSLCFGLALSPPWKKWMAFEGKKYERVFSPSCTQSLIHRKEEKRRFGNNKKGNWEIWKKLPFATPFNHYNNKYVYMDFFPICSMVLLCFLAWTLCSSGDGEKKEEEQAAAAAAALE